MDKGLVLSVTLGLLIRLAFMAYGIWQDSTMKVKYTDVDYHVFTDAAKFVTQAESPYKRATYRYTPLLAWLLTPNIYCTVHFGKIVFIMCDVIASFLIFQILRTRGTQRDVSLLCAQSWLFNPLAITVSSRGNAESIMAVLVLSTLYCLAQKGMKYSILASLLYATSVHMKIYPIIYALPMYLYMNSKYDGHPAPLTVNLWILKKLEILPTKTRLIFAILGASILIGSTWLCYAMYGDEFLQETYLYHVTRKDTRHNFSPYFYMLYLTSETDWAGLMGLLAFLPQAILTILVSLAYYEDLPFCCFIQTFIFVTFNKVCTSQYFLWYLCLLPLIIPNMRVSLRHTLLMVVAWFAGQVLWLCPAYYLEFEGKQSFIWIWAAGLIFFAINVAILQHLIKSYTYIPFYPGDHLPEINNIKVPDMWKTLFSFDSINLKSKVS